MQLPKICSSEELLTQWKCGDGFSKDDIITQARRGVHVNDQNHTNFNTNAVLPVAAASEMDKVILQAVTAKPRIYMDLAASGCVARIPFGTYISRYAKQNLADRPSVGMDFKYQGGRYSNAQQTQSDFKDIATPVPLLWYDFELSKREIAAANNTTSMFGGLALETQEIRVKSIGLASAMEEICWYGNESISLNGVPLTGIVNNPLVQARAQDITFSKSEPDAFISDFLQLALQPLLNQNYDGNDFIIYYSKNLQFIFEGDYLDQVPLRTITQRLKQISNIQDVRSTAFLNPIDAPTSQTEGQLVIIKMDPQVIDVVVESEIRTAQYANDPQMVKYLMFAALAPRVKEDYNGKVGIQLVNITVEA